MFILGQSSRIFGNIAAFCDYDEKEMLVTALVPEGLSKIMKTEGNGFHSTAAAIALGNLIGGDDEKIKSLDISPKIIEIVWRFQILLMKTRIILIDRYYQL